MTLNKRTILTLLRALSDRLARAGAHGDLYLYGGAALVLSSAFRSAARDIDGYVDNDRVLQEIFRSALGVGAACGLDQPTPDNWLDLNRLDMACLAMQRGDFFLPMSVSDRKYGGLGVFVLKAPAQLALKLIRLMPSDKDYADMTCLSHAIGLYGPDALQTLWQRHAPYLPHGVTTHVRPTDIARHWDEIERRRVCVRPPCATAI